MAKYEMLYLLNNDLSDEQKDAKIAKFEGVVTSMGGSVASSEKWGTKKTAYPIKFKNVSREDSMTAPEALRLGLALSSSISASRSTFSRSWSTLIPFFADIS